MFNTFSMTHRQVRALLALPPEDGSIYNENPHWVLEKHEDGRLEVKFDYLTIHGWSRYITEEGRIERYDEDTDTFVPAGADPLFDSYTSRSLGRVVAYRY